MIAGYDPETLKPIIVPDSVDDIPIRPIPPFPSSPPKVLSLPEWVKDIPPPEVNVSVFDRATLHISTMMLYSKWAVTLIRFTLELINFIQRFKRRYHNE